MTSTQTITIQYTAAHDSFGEQATDADRASFCDALASEIGAEYPDATISVEARGADTRVEVLGTADVALIDRIRRTVRGLAEDVWNLGAFWS